MKMNQKSKFVRFTDRDMYLIGDLILIEDVRMSTDGKRYISEAVMINAYIVRKEIESIVGWDEKE